MRRFVTCASGATVLLGIFFYGSFAAAQSPYEKLLTIADVEKAAGVHGVKSVARMSAPGAGGELNFATADGKLLVMVNFGNAQLYQRARQPHETNIGGNVIKTEMFAHAVPGVGDDAFDSPAGAAQYALYARKGDKAVSVTTYPDGPQAKPRLTIEQLKAMASTIFSRW